MAKTKDAALTSEPYATGPGGGEERLPAACQNCGRPELVHATLPDGDDQAPVHDAVGDVVKPGSKVTICTLCGVVQSDKTLKEGGRTVKRSAPAKSKKTTTTSASRKKSSAPAARKRKTASARKRKTSSARRGGR